MMPVANEEYELYLNQINCHISKKSSNITVMIQIILKLKITVIILVRGAVHSICNSKYNVPKEIPVVFHNGSKYDYHFIIKELAKTFEREFNCLGENTKKYKTISVPITKEVKRIGKNWETL